MQPTQEQINVLCEALTALKAEKAPHMNYRFEAMPGKKYSRIVAVDYNQRSAWAFIDLSNGDVLKPAGWASPAKHARGNLFKFLESKNLSDAGFGRDGYINYLR